MQLDSLEHAEQTIQGGKQNFKPLYQRVHERRQELPKAETPADKISKWRVRPYADDFKSWEFGFKDFAVPVKNYPWYRAVCDGKRPLLFEMPRPGRVKFFMVEI